MTQSEGIESAAEPMTIRVGRRVAEHRKAAGMSQTELGERMTELGARPPWGRTTVAKLESGNRNSVSVQELLALALVFAVPPVLLLADPRSTDTVPIADGVEVDSWSALLWLIGFAELGTTPDRRGAVLGTADDLIYDGVVLVDMFEQLASRVRLGRGGADREAAATRELHVRALDSIAATLRRIADAGAPAPVLPGYVVDRARELGVALPGVEG